MKTEKRWKEICEIEPKLKELEEVLGVMFPPGHRENYKAIMNTWGGMHGFKNAMSRLVGMRAEKEEINNTEDYDVAYEKLFFRTICGRRI